MAVDGPLDKAQYLLRLRDLLESGEPFAAWRLLGGSTRSDYGQAKIGWLMSSGRLPKRAYLPLQDLTAQWIVRRNHIQEIAYEPPFRNLVPVQVSVNDVFPTRHREM